jgi:hypothetical protein
MIGIGDWVLYTLSDSDERMINSKRADTPGINYNPAIQGQTFPALLVAVYGQGGLKANLRVFLDGEDILWIPQREESVQSQEGYFHKADPWKPFDG